MGKFVIRKVPTGIKFDLKAANGEVIATSEVYTSDSACSTGIESVRKNAPKAGLEDQTKRKQTETVKNPKFEIYKDAAGKFRFRLRAKNGETIAVSEGYNAKASCINGNRKRPKKRPGLPHRSGGMIARRGQVRRISLRKGRFRPNRPKFDAVLAGPRPPLTAHFASSGKMTSALSPPYAAVFSFLAQEAGYAPLAHPANIALLQTSFCERINAKCVSICRRPVNVVLCVIYFLIRQTMPKEAFAVAYRLDDTELFLFGEGTNAYAYRALGCHLVRRGKTPVARFAVWAPNARAVSVVGDFNGWDTKKNPMTLREGTGVWECHIPGIAGGELYKYAITAMDGTVLHRADPFAFYSERPPGTASVVWDLRGYKWKDGQWMKRRREYRPYGEPVSIFEVHLGSWRGHTNYRDMADELAQYAKYMGYTHVELMPVAEHPFDGSWGYQVTGYFSVTSRYGTPQDFMYFVDRLHQEGIGVIMDWVPAHFPKDEHGLRLFDGTPCYESANPLEAEQPQWGTLLFNYSRNEVRSFLISNALFWLDVYHIDGLRADAVSCMLYRDYGKAEGEWVPNRYGGRENLEAIAFLQKTGEMIFKEHPGALFCAEESTSFPLVTRPKEDGGLTFNYKWNMGWMNDMLEYMSLDPIYRKWHHDKLTFSMMYAFSENFILPLSHDEVVHGKKSLIGRMPGDYWQQFANLRVLFCFMFGHPGKKLMFMGDEIAQFIEWRYYEPIEYKLLAFDMHKKFQSFIKALNELYVSTPALYEIDDSWDGFQWLSVNDADRSIAAFARMGEKPDELMVCAFNFTPNPVEAFRLGVPRAGIYFEALNSDDERFGGTGVVNTVPRRTEHWAENGFFQSIVFRLPPLGGVFLRFSPEAGEGRVKPAGVKDSPADPYESLAQTAQLQEISAKAGGIFPKCEAPKTHTPALKKEHAV